MPTPEARAERRRRVADKLEKALGANWRERLARALGRDPAAIRRLFSPPKGRTDAPTPELEALSEFLISCKPSAWPARWHRP